MMTLDQTLALVRPNIAALEPYSTARDEYRGTIGTYLDANENPFGTWNRYPSTGLRGRVLAKIAAVRSLPSGNLFLGNGSDEAIDLCFRVFCTPGEDNAVGILPSYGMYSVCAAINDVEYRGVLLNEDFSLPVERLLDAADKRTKLLFICSPNNPTANAFPVEDILSVVSRFNGIVVLDEAYVDFSTKGSLAPVLAEYPNLIVFQTLSKAYGMAGLRMGIALAAEPIVRIFDQVRYPYNVGTDTLSLAEKMLETHRDEVQTLVSERKRLEAALPGFSFIDRVYPSDANFLLIKTAEPRRLYDFLLAAGLIVRDRSRVPLCEGCLRITVGTPDENTKLLDTLMLYGK